MKIVVQNEEQTIFDLKNQIQVRDDTIEQKETHILEEKLKMKDLEKQLLLMKDNMHELEQTVEPLIMEIQDKKKVIEDVSAFLIVIYAKYVLYGNLKTKEKQTI